MPYELIADSISQNVDTPSQIFSVNQHIDAIMNLYPGNITTTNVINYCDTNDLYYDAERQILTYFMNCYNTYEMVDNSSDLLYIQMLRDQFEERIELCNLYLSYDNDDYDSDDDASTIVGSEHYASPNNEDYASGCESELDEPFMSPICTPDPDDFAQPPPLPQQIPHIDGPIMAPLWLSEYGSIPTSIFNENTAYSPLHTHILY